MCQDDIEVSSENNSSLIAVPKKKGKKLKPMAQLEPKSEEEPDLKEEEQAKFDEEIIGIDIENEDQN